MNRWAVQIGRAAAVRAALVLLFVCVMPLDALALPGSARMSQMAHTAWTLQDGAFPGALTSIAQTTDGYLWIGTNNGLTRFDGVRYVPWSSPDPSNGPNPNIISLFASRDGSLWMGTGSGIARLKGGVFTRFPQARGRVAAIAEDSAGTIWFVRQRTEDKKGPLCSIIEDSVRCYGVADGIAAPYGSMLALAPDGSIWIGHATGLTKWKKGGAQTFEVPSLKAAEGLNGLAAILSDSDGCVFVGFERAGAHAGLQRLCDGHWSAFTAPGLDGRALLVGSALQGADGTLWIGTVAGGLLRVQGNSVERYGASDGLSSDGVVQILEDREGTLWVVTSQGLDRFPALKVVSHTLAQGLSANIVQSVLASSSGKIWISNEGSLDAIDHGKVSSIKEADGLPGQRVTSLFEDHDHALWVGVDNQLYVYEQGVFKQIDPAGTPLLGTVLGLAEDTAHDMWAVTANPLALVHIRGRRVIDRLDASRLPPSVAIAADPRGGLLLGLMDGRLGRYRDGHLDTVTPWPSNERRDRVGNMIVEPDGSVWASSTSGLLAWRGDIVKVFTNENGLPCYRASSIARARNGDLWLSQVCGFVRIPHEQLEDAWNRGALVLKGEVLDRFDGALSGRSTFSPSSSTAPDGTVWFANETILQSIDPEHLPFNDKIPAVHIEQIVADHKPYSPKDSLRFSGRTRDLEIDYTALSLAVPGKVRFQYRLEGWDQDWKDPGTRRQAFYTNLDPGNYVFRVRASNNDGVWNTAGATAAFAILPLYYQTIWFGLLTLASFAALLYVAYRFRMRQLATQIKAGMLERLSERERIARDLHDNFFQAIQGLLLRFNTATSHLKAEEPARAILLETLQQSDTVMLEGRELVLELRGSATDELNLSSALTQSGEEFKKMHAAEFVSLVLGWPKPLHPVCAEELLRLGREALYNAFRHAQATRIEVELQYEATVLTLRVRDDGQGIDEKILEAGLREGHLGLPGMQERARMIGARIRVLSRRGSGTEIEVKVSSSIAYAGYRRKGLRALLDTLARKRHARLEADHG